jgi:hypothetical protein
MIPGLIAGILSAIFQANGNNNMNGSYNINNKDPTLNQLQQGGIQLAGLGIAIGCGLFVGIVSGIIMKIFNREYISQQFDCSYVVRENRIEHVPEKY